MTRSTRNSKYKRMCQLDIHRLP